MVTLNDITSKVTNSINFGGLGKGFTYLLIFLVFAIIIGVLVYFIIIQLRFNKKITVFEVNPGVMGGYSIKKNKAMSVAFGDGGEEILKLKKGGKYKPAYGRKMGNSYWFVVGTDGIWRNVTLENFDEKMKTLGISVVDRDVRMANVAIRKNLAERFDKVTFLQKYGGMIAFAGLIFVMSIGFWFVTRELKETAAILAGSMDTAKQVLEASRQILAANENILSSGGLRPA